MSPLLGEEQLQLHSQFPVRAEIGLFDIVVGGELGIDRLLADFENLTDAAAKGHRPAVAAFSLPVGVDDRRRGQVETVAVRDVVVDEILPGKEVDILISRAAYRLARQAN